MIKFLYYINIAVVLCVVIGQLYADKCGYHTICRYSNYGADYYSMWYSLASMAGTATAFFFSIFSVSCFSFSK